ncbi:hypothetical protein ACDQ55_10275 [Chitinophaga sp. 30R24]|uniref:hypothetical protein n=1 Tax=Chitinophaga sp. 30R24 TaxID=3248838 RepID=UPI003B916190
MIVYVIKKRKKLINWITLNQVLVLSFFLHAILIFVFGGWFLKNVLVSESGVLALLCLRMGDKKERYVYKIIFDNDKKQCFVHFYQFLIFKFVKQVYYSDMSVMYARIRYGRGVSPLTLRIKEHKKMLAEIREKRNLGWTSEEMLAIYKMFEKIKNDNDGDSI